MEIYCNDSILTLRDSRSLSIRENEMQVQFTGKKELQKLVFEFEKRSKPGYLSVWSDDNFDQLVKTFFAIHEEIQAAGGVVFNEHGEILFIHRNGKWDLPKGKISGKDRKKAEKELPEKKVEAVDAELDQLISRIAAIREVKEETGLKNVTITSELPFTYHIYLNGERRIIKHTRWYRMEATSRECLKPQVSEGIIIARWIPANSLACIFLHTYESLKPLIKSVLANT